ncbi:hypothetical protein [Bacillus massilinigeriensis]|nr:hypothetical protein [Bacillus mediterraneensis]
MVRSFFIIWAYDLVDLLGHIVEEKVDSEETDEKKKGLSKGEGEGGK